MKQIYKLLLSAVLLMPGCLVQGQTGEGLPTPAFHWQCASGPAYLNGHPAAIASALHFDSIPYSADYTVVAVYKPLSDTDAAVWTLNFADGSRRGLGTGSIVVDSISIRCSGYGDSRPVVGSLRQSAPDSTAPYATLDLGNDSSVAVAEVLYFGHRLSNAALRRVQSLLALRYGITLGPVSYTNGHGASVWDYADSGTYHHRVAGIGNDTVSGLLQLRSRSEMEAPVLTLSSASLPAGSYLVAGDDSGDMEFASAAGPELLLRTWRIQATGISDIAARLVFDLSSIASPHDSVALVCGALAYPPTSCAGDSVVFDSVIFPQGASLVTLGRGTALWQMAQGKKAGALQWQPGSDVAVSAYPNPGNGHYTLDISNATEVTVTVYDIHGTVVATHSGSGTRDHHFTGTLPGSGVYFATVSAAGSTQTLKLIVR